LATNPDSAIAHYWIGKFLLTEGRHDEAMGQFIEATHHGSVVYEPDIKLGDDCISRDQFSQARDWFSHATQLQPDSILAHQSLAFSLAFLHEYRPALAEYELAYRLHLEKTGITGDAAASAFAAFAPDLATAQDDAARADQYATGGNIPEAQEYDLKALAMDSSYTPAQQQLEKFMRITLFGPQSSVETSGE